MNNSEWIKVIDFLPEENVVVDTKIDDGMSLRNEQPLKRMRTLWFHEDSSTYVYYTPTHWKPKKKVHS